MGVGTNAAVYFVNFAAIFTMEMVMVVFAGHFVASALAWNFYGFKNAIFGEKLDAAVDSSYA